MKKQRFEYSISGYRWAPESFHVRKGLEKQSLKAVPLSYEERKEVGLLFITKGADAAVAHVKHLERAQERQRKSIVTYGFRAKEARSQFVYCPQLYCRADAPLDERLHIFKVIRNVLEETDGRAVVSTQCDLDGAYRSTNATENTITADFDCPISISLGHKRYREVCQSRPVRLKKPLSHKRKKHTPTR